MGDKFPALPPGNFWRPMVLSVLLLGAIAGGVGMWQRPTPSNSATIWLFSELHAKSLRAGRDDSLLSLYQRQFGQSVQVVALSSRALETRLSAMIGSPQSNLPWPDVVELEIGALGKFFRPPAEEMGFLPLNDLIESSHWRRRILPQRLAAWTRQGQVMGLPLDVHPVALIYRRDLMRQAGVDWSTCPSWEEFASQARKYRQYQLDHGQADRYALELKTSGADQLMLLLQQQGLQLVDACGQLAPADRRVAQTIASYVDWVSGPTALGTDSSQGAGLWIEDLRQGRIAAVFAPDWRLEELRNDPGPPIGQLAMRPLPIFQSGDSPTCSWGGTMVGIPRRVADPVKAFRLLEFLYFSDQALQRRAGGDILPPLPQAWHDPAYQLPDRLFANQRFGPDYMGRQLYVRLAQQLPDISPTPYDSLVAARLSMILGQAMALRRNDAQINLVEPIGRLLNDSREELRRWIRFSQFPPLDKD